MLRTSNVSNANGSLSYPVSLPSLRPELSIGEALLQRLQSQGLAYYECPETELEEISQALATLHNV